MPPSDAAPRAHPDSSVRHRPWTGREGLVYWACGLLLLVVFYGDFLFSDRLGILDWGKDLFYFSFLQDALRTYGRLPLSFLAIPDDIAWFSTLQDLSYWSNPEVISLSPLLPLALVLPVMAFIKVFFGLHLLAAVWGVGLLSRRLGWDTLQSVLLLVLFLCNPWLVQHLTIGYSPQISLCLVPALAALCVAPDFRPLEWAGASLLAALIFYQGALHLFVWLFMAFGVLVLAQAILARRLYPVWRAAFFGLATLVLVWPKALAVSKVYGGWSRIPAGGYTSLSDLWGLLTDDVFFMFQFPETYSKYNVAFYDGSLLVGPAFVLLTAWLAAEYGLALVRGRVRPNRETADAACLVGAAVFLVLGWGTVWRDLSALLHLPSSEIYPFRYLFISYNLLLFFVVDRIGPFPANRPGRARTLTLCGLMALTLLTFYGRNRMLMPYLTENPNLLGPFSITEFYSNRITAFSGDTRLPVTPTPNRVTIVPSGIPGERIALPWLPHEAAGRFEYENARPVGKGPGNGSAAGTVIEVTAPAAPVVVRPRDYHRNPLLAGAALAFAALTAGVARLHRRRPALFSAPAPGELRHA